MFAFFFLGTSVSSDFGSGFKAIKSCFVMASWLMSTFTCSSPRVTHFSVSWPLSSLWQHVQYGLNMPVWWSPLPLKDLAGSTSHDWPLNFTSPYFVPDGLVWVMQLILSGHGINWSLDAYNACWGCSCTKKSLASRSWLL